MATVETLLTAEEFGNMPDDGRRAELIRARIVEMPPPGYDHGEICAEVAYWITAFAKPRRIGRVVANDSGVVTIRDPDTVRGADVAYYSYARIPKGRSIRGYPEIAPELVIEVRSPSDRQVDIDEKVAEYLAAEVLVVCVLDPEDRTGCLFRPGQPAVVLGPDDELTFPEVLGDFRVLVGDLFGI